MTRDFVGTVLAESTKMNARLEIHTPPTIDEATLRVFAQSVRFDVCFLTLNNIRYTRHEPIADRLQSSVTLVRDLVQQFSKPVLALFGWPDDAKYPARVIETGAVAVFRLPVRAELLRDAITEALELPA